MKYIKIENGFISENAIASVVANAVSKIAGVSKRHGQIIDEFIYSVSGYDVNKGIKLVNDEDSIKEINVYIDLEKGNDIVKVIEDVIQQIQEDLKIFITLEPNVINVHVLEVK